MRMYKDVHCAGDFQTQCSSKSNNYRITVLNYIYSQKCIWIGFYSWCYSQRGSQKEWLLLINLLVEKSVGGCIFSFWLWRAVPLSYSSIQTCCRYCWSPEALRSASLPLENTLIPFVHISSTIHPRSSWYQPFSNARSVCRGGETDADLNWRHHEGCGGDVLWLWCPALLAHWCVLYG